MEKSDAQSKFCAENGLNFKAFKKIRFRVREIYGAVRQNNPDAFIEDVDDSSDDDSDDEVSDAETVASVMKEREDNEAVFRRELAAIAPEDVLPTLDEYINELTKI